MKQIVWRDFFSSPIRESYCFQATDSTGSTEKNRQKLSICSHQTHQRVHLTAFQTNFPVNLLPLEFHFHSFLMRKTIDLQTKLLLMKFRNEMREETGDGKRRTCFSPPQSSPSPPTRLLHPRFFILPSSRFFTAAATWTSPSSSSLTQILLWFTSWLFWVMTKSPTAKQKSPHHPSFSASLPSRGKIPLVKYLFSFWFDIAFDTSVHSAKLALSLD